MKKIAIKKIVIKKLYVSNRMKISSNVNEVVRAVLSLFAFFYEKILHAQKAQKAQKRR